MAKIYQTFSYADAQCRVNIASNKGEADLWVYNVNSRGMANGDALWYVTDNRSEASKRIHFCSRGMSELIIYFVDNKLEAGWQKKHRLQYRL